MHLTFVLLASHYFPLLSVFESPDRPIDVFLVDQLSVCIPFLRWGFGKRVVFYCHFPDKLLAGGKVAAVEGVGRTTSGGLKDVLKKLYRVPVDWIEETTTGEPSLHYLHECVFNL